MFLNAWGRIWTRSAWLHALKQHCQAADVPRRRPHQLRHLWASLAAADGLSADAIQAALTDTNLTHSTPQDVATRRYSSEHRHTLVDNSHSIVCPYCGRKLNTPNG